MPYKTLADTRPTTPTGAAVAKNTIAKAPVETTNTVTPVKVETVKSEIPAGPSCKDSDYGKFSNAVGIVKGIDADGSEYEISDACLGNVLFEYFCVDNKAEFEQIKCARGCTNGFCV